MQIIRVRSINSDKILLGCEGAPVEILSELKKIGSSESGKIIEFEKLNLEEIHVNLDNIPEANHLIFENSKEAFERNFKTLFIGGDHNISYSILRAFKKIEENPLLILFDAHLDSKNSHKEPKNTEWLKKLLQEGFRGSNVILISARNLFSDEILFLKENKITWIKMDLLQEELSEICDLVMERARKSSGFYISIDINSVDPAFAPGTNSIMPGGLSSREIIYFIKRLKLLENFRGADIVEINPNLDKNKMTVKLGAKLLAEMI